MKEKELYDNRIADEKIIIEKDKSKEREMKDEEKKEA